MVRRLEAAERRHEAAGTDSLRRVLVRTSKGSDKMSTDSSGEPDRVPGLLQLGEDGQGRQVMAMPYSEKLAAQAVENGLAEKTQTEPEPEDREGSTPDPGSTSQEYKLDAGPIRRFNDIFTDLGSVQLEAMGLDGHEVANATMTLRNEMYRSQFPVIQPRFTAKCADEECGAEYDKDIEFCLQCARREMMEDGHTAPPTDEDEVPEEYQDHPVRPPNPSEKREAQKLAESVNKEGQSLRELMKMLEDDQSRLGVSVVIAKKKYAIAEGDTPAFERGDIIWEDVDELVRGDPKRVVPVVDENGRVGNYWWTCPVHRNEALTDREDYEENYQRHCEHCGAELREVYFAETQSAGRHSRRDDNAAKYYFQDEVITWARYFPRLHGLDGLSPIHHIWLKQAILHWMDIYGAAFYDPDSERYPNKFMVVHTTNPKAWEKQLAKAEEDSKENPYSEQIMFNEYSGESNTTPEVQVIDLMSDELLGQDQQIKDQYKQDIRTQFGVTNVFDSELSDAGGLNNEGLQMEVTDRTIASAMHDTVAGPLDELAKVLGIDDYIFEFVPPQDTDIEELRNNIEVGEKAVGTGLDARLEDNKVEVSDGEFEEGEDDGGNPLAGMFADFDGEEPLASLKADPMVNGHDLDPETGEGVCEETGETINAETMGDLTDDCPHCGEALSVLDEEADAKGDGGDSADGERPWRHDGTSRTPARESGKEETARKRHDPIRFGNVGGDPFETQDDLEAFCEDLEDAGADVMLGDEPWEHASGIHDRPVVAYGITLEDAEGVWADHVENALAVGGPSVDEKSWEGEEGNERWLRSKMPGWVPYQGPQGGVGWRHTETGDVTYDDEPPGEVTEEFDQLRSALSDMSEQKREQALETLFELDTEHQDFVTSMLPRLTHSTARNFMDVMATSGPDIVNTLVTMLGEEREGPETAKSEKEQKLEDIRTLDKAYEHIVWADETTKAEPFWDDDESVPDFVLEVIGDVIPDVLETDLESLPGAIGSTLIDIFEDNLTQEQGWSLASISRNIRDEFGVGYDEAELVARTETSKIMNEAREEGYERVGALEDDDRKFHWKGPGDVRTTDACEWMKQATGYSSSSDMLQKYGEPESIDNPGEPVTYDELIALEKEATEKFFPHLGYRKHCLHPNERHTFSETFKMDHPGAAGPIEVDYDYDWSAAMPAAGNFEAVST